MLTGYGNQSPVNMACTRQSFACLQPQNTDYRTYKTKTTLKVQVKCNYYANITSVMTCGIWQACAYSHSDGINSGNGNITSALSAGHKHCITGPAASSLQFRADSTNAAAATMVPPPPAKRVKETSRRTGWTTGWPVTAAVWAEHRYRNRTLDF